MKKKLIAIIACIAALATVAIGGTMAYFSDTDAQTNTFTVGNVAIDLWEDFGDNDGWEELIPAVGSAQNGTLKNGIEKKVYVENTGSEDAYVRVQIAIPAILDDPQNASYNVLHFNYDNESVGEKLWDWSNSGTDGVYAGKDWNTYTTTIDEIKYNVYVVTYGASLKKDDVTVDAIHQVYMDSHTTNEDVATIKNTLGDNWKIIVVAEATQAAGFDDAYTALNTAFGVPGEYTVDFSQAAENKTSQSNNE